MRDFQTARQSQSECPTPRAKMMNFEILRRGPQIFGAKREADYGTNGPMDYGTKSPSVRKSYRPYVVLEGSAGELFALAGAAPQRCDHFAQGIGLATAIGGIGRQVADQAAMGFGQRMIRHRGEDMVQGMVTQTDRRPQTADDGIVWVVHRVEHLFDEGHLAVAQVRPAMGPQRAKGVDRQDEHPGEVRVRQERPGQRFFEQQPTRPEHADRHEPDEQKDQDFLNADDGEHLLRGKRTDVRGIHDHRRRMLVDPAPNRRTDPREWREHAEPKDRHDRDDQDLRQIKQDLPRGKSRQRDVFAVFLRAVVLPAMVIEMGVVNEGRNQERDSAQQVPNKPEGSELAGANVNQFVDEQRAAIDQERGNDEADNADRPVPTGIGRDPLGEVDKLEAEDADRPTYKEIGPVDPEVGREELANDGSGLAQREITNLGGRI
jgi:hypothetical protein